MASTTAEAVAGEEPTAPIVAEDLSRRMVDTEARDSTRSVLRDRLRGLLATRKRAVANLVEAERSLARVDAGIDQAKNRLEEMRGCVALARGNAACEANGPVARGLLTRCALLSARPAALGAMCWRR